MKKALLISSFLVLLATTAFGQAAVYNGKEATKTGEIFESPLRKPEEKGAIQPEAPIWFEDFANGIPNGWTNAGFDEFGAPMTFAKWEYRGTTTTPNNTVGSRGAYNSGRGPIQSPTTNNGFVIFDSDFLDGGGNGLAPAPHTGTLTTPTINLNAYPFVELKINSYHRYYEGRALVAFSTDGGITWPDTVACHPTLSVNFETAPNTTVELNVSRFIGNKSNVKIQFIFDGQFDDPGAAGSGSGYYFWMIDDIEINPLPKHDIRFTTWQTAPAQDVLFGPANLSSKMGHLAKSNATNQTRAVTFDANAFNYGYGSLDDVKLKVYILDHNNTLITAFTSDSAITLNSNDTANYNILNTYSNSYTHNVNLPYNVFYEVLSDSANIVSDTFTFSVSETAMGIDFGYESNSLGTPQLGDDNSALGSRIDLVNEAYLKWAWIGLSSLSEPNGIIEIQVYDTVGFDFTTGFPSSSLVGTSINPYTLTQADIDAGFVKIPLTDGNKNHIHLTEPSYFIIAKLYSNIGANPIRIRNDQTFTQPLFSSIMYNADDAMWYTHYINSFALDGIQIRGLVSNDFIGINETDLTKKIVVSPNPVSTILNISATDLEDDMQIDMIDLTGKVVLSGIFQKSETNPFLDVSSLSKGVYALQIRSNQESVSFKIIVN